MTVDRDKPESRPDAVNPELLAVVRIILVVGVLALVLGVLNHFV
ncbi:hypothetical protein [Kribbella lupini]|uniref:Flagellin-like protein n=1 Tax=Kribbella lupini TaxID=291602 RepID=A0ABN2AQT5_9ACTN